MGPSRCRLWRGSHLQGCGSLGGGAGLPRSENLPAAGRAAASAGAGRPRASASGREQDGGQGEDPDLRSFRAIAKSGSFHAAADLLEYTQSGVSQHLAALESIVGARLIERSRGRRRVELTEAGRLLLRHADAIVARLSAAQADLRSYAEGASGVLRVGTYQSVSARILPALVSQFSASWPGVEIRLHEELEDIVLLSFVESGELDLAFTVFPLPAGPFDSIELLPDPWVLLVARGSPMARYTRAPALQEIVNQPLIGFRHGRTTELAEAHLRRSGLEPRVVFRSNDNATVQGLVAAGLGAAFVPLLAVDADDPHAGVRESFRGTSSPYCRWDGSPNGRQSVRISIASVVQAGRVILRYFPPRKEAVCGQGRNRSRWAERRCRREGAWGHARPGEESPRGTQARRARLRQGRMRLLLCRSAPRSEGRNQVRRFEGAVAWWLGAQRRWFASACRVSKRRSLRSVSTGARSCAVN
jgi:DNA-binding transcriptional LysR family regulator